MIIKSLTRPVYDAHARRYDADRLAYGQLDTRLNMLALWWGQAKARRDWRHTNQIARVFTALFQGGQL